MRVSAGGDPPPRHGVSQSRPGREIRCVGLLPNFLTGSLTPWSNHQ
jgi:hypothetical protein